MPGAPPSPPTWPPPQMGIGAAATPREGTLGGGAALPLPLYIVEAKGQPNTEVLAQPSPSPKSSSSPAVLGEALRDCHAPPSPPRHRAAAGWSLPQPLPLSLLDQGMGDITGLYVC